MSTRADNTLQHRSLLEHTVVHDRLNGASLLREVSKFPADVNRVAPIDSGNFFKLIGREKAQEATIPSHRANVSIGHLNVSVFST